MRAGLHLACAFPPSLGYHGAGTTIADLNYFPWHHPLRSVMGVNKRDAVRLIVAKSMQQYEGFGKGAKSKARIPLRYLCVEATYSHRQLLEMESVVAVEGRQYAHRPKLEEAS